MSVFFMGYNGRTYAQMPSQVWHLLHNHAMAQGCHPSGGKLLCFPSSEAGAKTVCGQSQPIAYFPISLMAGAGIRIFEKPHESLFDPWDPCLATERFSTYFPNGSMTVERDQAVAMADALERSLEQVEDDELAQGTSYFIRFCRISRGFEVGLSDLRCIRI
jgi:hypothetical protein